MVGKLLVYRKKCGDLHKCKHNTRTYNTHRHTYTEAHRHRHTHKDTDIQTTHTQTHTEETEKNKQSNDFGQIKFNLYFRTCACHLGQFTQEASTH